MLYDSEQKEYTIFAPYAQLFNEDCIKALTKVLDGYKKVVDNFPDTIPLIKKYIVLPQYEEKDKAQDDIVKNATLQDRVMMYGICLYLQHSKSFNKTIFTHWLRVLGNLAKYNEIASKSVYETRLKFVHNVVGKIVHASVEGYCAESVSLEGEFRDIYSSDVLTDINDLLKNDPDSEDQKQLREEIEKIKKINNKVTEKLLMNLESLWIFDGRISCLLDSDLLNCDNLYSTLYAIIGDRTTVVNSGELLDLFRAIITKTTDDFDFSVNDEHNNLRKLLNVELKDAFQAVMKDLLNEKTLGSIIEDYKYNQDDWKYAVVKDVSIWRYAERGKFVKGVAYKSKNKNEKDISLRKYSKFLYQQEQNNGFPSSIKFQENKKWEITYKEPKQETYTTIEYSEN